jgi:hypothetical protein
MKKQTRITAKPDGDGLLIEIEAVAIRKEVYSGKNATTETAYDHLTVTVSSANVNTTHHFETRLCSGRPKNSAVRRLFPLPLQEDERFGQVVRELMLLLIDAHIVQIKQIAEILPEAKERGQLEITQFSSTIE